MFHAIRKRIVAMFNAMDRATEEHHRKMREAGYRYCQTCGNPNKVPSKSNCSRCGYCGCCL